MRKKLLLTFICLLLISLTLISCSSDPYAQNRKYHMIAVGYDYKDSAPTDLSKDIDDAVQVAKCFESLSGGNIDIHYILGSDTSEISKYGITDYSSPTTANIQSAINEVMETAMGTDITVFYFSGHGDSANSSKVSYENGFTQDLFLATQNSGHTYDEYRITDLFEDLSTIPGTKLIILDSCYSGGALPPNNISSDSSLYEDTDIFRVFLNSEINVAYPDIFALTASSYYTTSSSAGYHHSKFTSVLLKALGWDDSSLLNPYLGTVLCKSGNEVTLSSLYDWIYNNGGVYHPQRPVASSTSADLVLFTF